MTLNLRFWLLKVIWLIVLINIPLDITYPSYIDPKLRPILNEFEADASKYGVSVDESLLGDARVVDLGELTDAYGVIGMCQTSIFGPFHIKVWHSNKVSISPLYLDNEYTFKALVYHELGHCLLYKDHIKKDGTGEIMSSHLERGELFYRTNWDSLVKELFTGQKAPNML